MTGFTPKVRKQIFDRDQGWCRRCGATGTNIQHRIGKGMGGTSRAVVNDVSAGVLVCGFGNTSGCHKFAESDPQRYASGFAIRRSDDRHPSEVPLIGLDGIAFWLTRDGGISFKPPKEQL